MRVTTIGFLLYIPKEFRTLAFHYKDQVLEINTETAKL